MLMVFKVWVAVGRGKGGAGRGDGQARNALQAVEQVSLTFETYKAKLTKQERRERDRGKNAGQAAEGYYKVTAPAA